MKNDADSRRSAGYFLEQNRRFHSRFPMNPEADLPSFSVGCRREHVNAGQNLHDQVYQSFRWEVPDFYNIGVDICG